MRHQPKRQSHKNENLSILPLPMNSKQMHSHRLWSAEFRGKTNCEEGIGNDNVANFILYEGREIVLFLLYTTIPNMHILKLAKSLKSSDQ